MAVIIVLTVIALAVFIARYGYDSRETAGSKEQELASYGMRWAESLAYEQELADELTVALSEQRDSGHYVAA